MEKFGTVIAVVGAIIFIVSMWMIFAYLYFKKGNLKKGFSLLLISLLLVGGGTFLGIKGAWNNEAKGISIPQNIVQIIESKTIEETTQEEQAQVGNCVYLKISQEDWSKYGDKIESYYVAWQKSLNPQAEEETIKVEFKNLREKAISN